jgi:hypothetical protein
VTCSVCVAAEHAAASSLADLYRREHMRAERMANRALTLEVDLIAARQRIDELEESIRRSNERLMRRRKAG